MIEHNSMINEGTMQEYDYNIQMYEQDTYYYPKNYKVRPGLVLRTADAYGISKNTDKYMDPTAFNTAIYGNKL